MKVGSLEHERSGFDSVANGALLGAAAGWCAALADVASTVLWLSDGPERARLTVALSVAGAGFGAWIGALIGLVFVRRRADSPPGDLVRIAALVAAPLAAVAYWLFTGGRARTVPALVIVRPIVWCSLVAVTTGTIAAAAAFARRARASHRLFRLATVALFVIAAQVFHALDHRVLPRLYEYLHAGLGMATGLAFAGAIFVASPRIDSSRIARRTLPFALALAPVAMTLLGRWDNARAEVFGVHAPFVRHGVLAIESLRSRAERRSRSTAVAPANTVDVRGLPARPGASVLLVTIDALRNDRVGRIVDGHSLTPQIDALATEGIRFVRTYAQAPHSSYSISSLHTGEYLHETVPLGQPQPLTTLADRFNAAGYYTAAFYTNGIFFTEGERLTVYRDRSYGFRRADHVDRRASAQAEAAMREIDDVVRRGEPPTFLWVHFFDTHEPYGGDGPTSEARYDSAVRNVDGALGALITYARSHLTRELVIAVTADHGEEFGEHGGVYHGSSLYDEQVRVPLVIAGPGLAHGSIETVAQLVDLAPTLLGAVGLSPSASMHGDDLRAWISGRTAVPRMAFSAVNTRSMVTDGRDKLIVDRRYGVHELFDLTRDPRELVNLASRSSSRTEQLDAALDAWSDAVGERATGRAVLARGRMGDRSALPDLVALARDGRASIAQRVEAMTVMGGYDDPSVTTPLRSLLGDHMRQIADAAAVALGRTGHDEAHDRLRDALHRDEPEPRALAAIALAHLHDPASMPTLVEQLYTGDEPARIDAVDALGALGSIEAVPALIDTLADDHLRYRTVLALGRIGGRDVLDRIEHIARSDRADDVRANAGAALALSEDRTRIAALRSLALHDGAQQYAASALALLGDGLYDARRDLAHACAPLDDGPVWRLLGARGCRIVTLEVTAFAGTAAGTLILRARGTGTLRVVADGLEVAHIDLEPNQREWRVPFTALPGHFALVADAPFTLAHVVFVP